MEGDSYAKKNKKKSVQNEGSISNASDVLYALWVRFSVQACNGLEWLLLDGRYYILFNFRVLLALIYLLYEMVKE
jgi:hypothetical protein